MKLPPNIKIYGDTKFRGKCPSESAEQMTFFNKLRREYPTSYGLVAVHIRNEGSRTPQETQRHKAEGLTTGASDIIIPGAPAFVCEMKRLDHTKCKISDEQIAYLEAAAQGNSFACIALGWEAAWEAFEEWQNHQYY